MIRYLTTAIALMTTLYGMPAQAQERDRDGFLIESIIRSRLPELQKAENGNLSDFIDFYDLNHDGEVTIDEYLDQLIAATDPRFLRGIYPCTKEELDAARDNLTREEYQEALDYVIMVENTGYCMLRSTAKLTKRKLKEQGNTKWHKREKNEDGVVSQADHKLIDKYGKPKN